MKVKDIIIKVLEMTENFDTALQINQDNVLTDEQNQLVSSYVNCFNNVRNEIASEILPNVKIEKIITSNGRIDYKSLSNDVIEVLSIRDNFGNSLKFDVFSDHIKVDADEVEVRYNASPENLTIEDELFSTIPERVFAYGILRENCYIQNLYEDASIWEERFKNSLQALYRKKNETVIPRRRWL